MAKNWSEAQKREKEFWESIYVEQKNDIDSYQRIDTEKSISFAEKILSRHQLLKENLSLMKVLDVGCGPYGIIKGLFHGRGDSMLSLYGIDPLMDTYRSFNSLPRDPSVCLFSGVGESLPFDDGFFDYIFCTNVLDHVNDPELVLGEIARALNNGGLFCGSIHVIYPLWRPFRFLLKFVDRNHPHHFTSNDFYLLLSQHFSNISITYKANMFEDQPEFRLRSILKSQSLLRGLKRWFSNYLLYSVYYNCGK
jgi:SAM-dependent methyltransferase